MKKTNLKTAIVTSIILMSCGTSALANNTNIDPGCAVLGIREPNTNIYDGPTWCPNYTLSYLTVRGPLQLDQTQVNGLTDVSGPVKSSGAILQDLLLEKQLTPVQVTLQSNSVINGNIRFLGKTGEVFLESGSIIKGEVINGKIIKNSSN